MFAFERLQTDKLLALACLSALLGCGRVTFTDAADAGSSSIDASFSYIDASSGSFDASSGSFDASSGSFDANAPSTRLITVTLGGDGAGSVTSTPAGLACPGTCTIEVAEGDQLTLEADPDSGSSFVGWTGGGCTGTGDCALTVTEDVSVQASFAQDNSLVVTKDGNGSGVIVSSPAGIDCGADCEEVYSPGQTVLLTATADTGSTFGGWSGGDCSGSGTCEVTLSSPLQVTGTFTLDAHTLTVSKAGTGSGTVTSSPPGINCGSDCSQAYDDGTSVVLTATPADGSAFTGWSDGCSNAGSCTVTLTDATNRTATFNTPTELTCDLVDDVKSCSVDLPVNVNLGQISADECQARCETALEQRGVSSGCWIIISSNDSCACRDGSLRLGGATVGGSCN